MATARPVVSVYQYDNPAEKKATAVMPLVLTSPLRPDVVRYVHTNMSKNHRQAYAVKEKAGYGTAAESWGTGRAVARIPRVPGGGTSRSGQAAFGNQARGGGMFNPTRQWRRWHRKLNITEKRHAVVTSLAASCLPPLVMAHGHRIGEVAELPLVVSDGIEGLQKTKQAVEVLRKMGLGEEMQRVVDSKKVRAGKGKWRNRRRVMRRGPLVVYKEDNGIVRAMRNIPGIETANVQRLNLLSLAPGGVFGRLLIWTEGAFNMLNEMYGKNLTGAPMKKGYHLPRAAMENADLARIINSEEVQSVLRPKLEAPKKAPRKKNPLVNKKVMALLNPGCLKRSALHTASRKEGTPEHEAVQAAKKARLAARKTYNKEHKKGDSTFYKKLMRAFESKNKKEAEGEGEEDKEEEA